MKAIVLIENGFQDTELTYPYYRLKEAGYEVKLVGPRKGETYYGGYGLELEADLAADDPDVSDYDVVVIPGGSAPDRMRQNKKMVKLVKKAVEKGLVVSAICHGPQLLIEADVGEG